MRGDVVGVEVASPPEIGRCSRQRCVGLGEITDCLREIARDYMSERSSGSDEATGNGVEDAHSPRHGGAHADSAIFVGYDLRGQIRHQPLGTCVDRLNRETRKLLRFECDDAIGLGLRFFARGRFATTVRAE